jgi:hypothetical protein
MLTYQKTPWGLWLPMVNGHGWGVGSKSVSITLGAYARRTLYDGLHETGWCTGTLGRNAYAREGIPVALVNGTRAQAATDVFVPRVLMDLATGFTQGPRARLRAITAFKEVFTAANELMGAHPFVAGDADLLRALQSLYTAHASLPTLLAFLHAELGVPVDGDVSVSP